MSLPQTIIEHAFGVLLERVRRDPVAWNEFQASRADFSLGDGGSASAHAAEMSARRHAEWFLLERASPSFDSIPAVSLGPVVAGPEEGAIGDWEIGCDALLGSFASVFEVTGVNAGEGVWVRDLAGMGEYPLEEAEASRALEPGDLLVGRIFPVGDAVYRISHASGFFRDAQLLAAVQKDLAQAREGRRGVLRLSQRDLEVMFFAGEAPASGPDARAPAAARLSPIAEARACLARGGLTASEIEDVLAGLASEPFDPRAILPGAGDRLGEILATLAFETDVDIEAARRALANAWPDLCSPPSRREKPARRATEHPTPPTPPTPSAPRAARRIERALAEFDARRAAGLDLEATFAELERALELEPESSADDAVAPDFPGVVGAMVVEFLWDMERERGEAAARPLAAIANFAQFARDQGVFENLGARDLLLYACLWLPERASSADEASRWFTALVEFAAWAEMQHDVLLAKALEPTRAGLARALPRAAEANARLRARLGPLREGGDMLVYEGGAAARSSKGEARTVQADAHVLELLEPGDFVRVQRVAPGAFDVVCVYPPETVRLASLG